MDDQGTQDTGRAQDGAWLPLADAALQLGLSAKTVRRRVKAGELVSRQVATRHGAAYEVWVATGTQPNGTVSRVPGVSPLPGTQRDDVTTLELVRLVDRLQRENRDLAGLVGALQERVGTLQAQLALQSPKPDAAEIAPASPPANGAPEPAQEPSAHKRPWWRRWLLA